MVRGRARTELHGRAPDHRVDQQLPNRTADDDGFIPKYGLELQITEDVMFYGIYSEGYRVVVPTEAEASTRAVQHYRSSMSQISSRTPNSA